MSTAIKHLPTEKQQHTLLITCSALSHKEAAAHSPVAYLPTEKLQHTQLSGIEWPLRCGMACHPINPWMTLHLKEEEAFPWAFRAATFFLGGLHSPQSPWWRGHSDKGKPTFCSVCSHNCPSTSLMAACSEKHWAKVAEQRLYGGQRPAHKCLPKPFQMLVPSGMYCLACCWGMW